MKYLIIGVIYFAIAAISFIAGHFLDGWILAPFQARRYGHEKHHCNHCKVSFFNTSIERKYYKFCPFCGRPVQYYYLDKRYKAEEKAIERANQIETIEEE